MRVQQEEFILGGAAWTRLANGGVLVKYEIAKKENIEQIYQLVQNTINAIYPLYYPQGVVEFFCGLHSKENIATDIENGFVRVLLSGDCLVGTGSCKENHISRLFVTSDFQKKGYGSYIMQCLEKEISLNNTSIYLDASLAAACFYEHRGYKTLKHEELFINGNARLAYEVMEKRIAVPNTDIFYDGKYFIPKMNTENGEVDNQTLFLYHQNENILWADYYGGEIKKGSIVGTVALNGEIDFYYQHINLSDQIRIGKCHSVPQILSDGRIELSEQWQWLNGDKSKGSSIVIEKTNDEK